MFNLTSRNVGTSLVIVGDYSVPVGKIATVLSIRVSNTTNSTVQASVSIYNGVTYTFLGKEVTIGPKKSLLFTNRTKVVLLPNDRIVVQSSAASSLDVIVSFAEYDQDLLPFPLHGSDFTENDPTNILTISDDRLTLAGLSRGTSSYAVVDLDSFTNINPIDYRIRFDIRVTSHGVQGIFYAGFASGMSGAFNLQTTRFGIGVYRPGAPATYQFNLYGLTTSQAVNIALNTTYYGEMWKSSSTTYTCALANSSENRLTSTWISTPLVADITEGLDLRYFYGMSTNTTTNVNNPTVNAYIENWYFIPPS
jgi:hypothetical protein